MLPEFLTKLKKPWPRRSMNYFLKTAVTQLEKKYEQICKADTQIAELIQELEELGTGYLRL